jgi:hypothetical protein
MTKETAEKVHQLLLDAAKAIDASIVLVQNDSSEDEFKQYRLGAGLVLSSLMEELMKQIYRQHADLIPAQLDRRYLQL